MVERLIQLLNVLLRLLWFFHVRSLECLKNCLLQVSIVFWKISRLYEFLSFCGSDNNLLSCVLSRIVNGIIIEWNKIFHEERTQKLNELIVESFCCCSPCCAHSFIFSIGFSLYSLSVLYTRNTRIYCGWSSDEY